MQRDDFNHNEDIGWMQRPDIYRELLGLSVCGKSGETYTYTQPLKVYSNGRTHGVFNGNNG